MSVQPPLRFPRDRPAEQSDRAYCLGRCHGFEVRAGGSHVGVVTDVRYKSRADVPDAILVRTGHVRHGLLVIPTDQIDEIDLDARRLTLE